MRLINGVSSKQESKPPLQDVRQADDVRAAIEISGPGKCRSRVHLDP